MIRPPVIKLTKRIDLLYQWSRYWLNFLRGAYHRGITIDGSASGLGPNICIISIFARQRKIPRSTLSLIRAVRSAGYGLVVVVNGSEIAKENFEGELRSADILITRPNLGRDFAAYQLAAKLVSESGLTVQRLLFCNDSIFFLDKNDTQNLFGRLIKAKDDWIGMTENYGGKYHVSSWCFQLSGNVLISPAYKEFWNAYRPLDSRRHAIRQGEIRFSQVMLAAGYVPTVLYSAALLLDTLLNGAHGKKEHLLQHFCMVTKRRDAPAPNLGSTLDGLFRGEQLNQTSNLGLLLVSEIDFPFLKKDIAFKANWPISVVVLLLQQHMSEFCAETANEIKLRGLRRGLSRWQKLLVDAGMS